MSGVLAVLSLSSTGAATKCEDVVFAPPDGTLVPVTVNLSTTTTNAHIFYTAVRSSVSQPTAITPTHTGDVATGSTVRIGTNNGNVNTGNQYCTIAAIAYEPTHLDSDEADAYYPLPAP